MWIIKPGADIQPRILDVVAFRFKCCGRYYAGAECQRCTGGSQDRALGAVEIDVKAVFCGICRNKFTLEEETAKVGRRVIGT
jgi:uncharacterized CHY-type Zn-finger protein